MPDSPRIGTDVEVPPGAPSRLTALQPLTRVRALTRRMRLKAFFVWYVVVGGVVRSNAIQ